MEKYSLWCSLYSFAFFLQINNADESDVDRCLSHNIQHKQALTLFKNNTSIAGSFKQLFNFKFYSVCLVTYVRNVIVSTNKNLSTRNNT